MKHTLSTKNFTYPIIEWFHQYGRHNLPWQQPRTPYRVWISEIMLQQTQVTTVIPYFERFMQSFPTLHDLANADLDTVLSHWSGLGYYRRAHHIFKAAQILGQDHNATFPNDPDNIEKLPGIGPSTAGAILSLGFDTPAVILDGNVKRVLTRVLDFPHPPAVAKHHKTLWNVAKTLLPQSDAAAYSQALMDLGATLCTKSDPSCPSCPIQTICKAYALGNHTERPVVIKSGKKKKQTRYVLMIENDKGELLLEKQEAGGLFPGLWHAPLIEDIESWCKQHGIDASIKNRFPPLEHHLSHIHYHFKPTRLKTTSNITPPDFAWHTPNTFVTLALPAWMRQCLKYIEEVNHE